MVFLLGKFRDREHLLTGFFGDNFERAKRIAPTPPRYHGGVGAGVKFAGLLSRKQRL
jgi:hypothetical protein